MRHVNSFSPTSQASQAKIRQTIIEPGSGWLSLRAVWQYRELLYFLIWRDIKVRYKQTALGVAWVILQPVASVLIYSGLFGVLLQVPSGDAPYPVFVLCGLLPWQYFAGSLAKSSNSLVDNSNLITKVYFPRLSIPLANILSGLVDFAIASSVLVVFMLIYQIHLSATIFFLPIFLMLAILTAMGFGLWFSALNVQYRDVKHLLPFVIQIWMYLTPVIYEVTLIPEPYRWLLALNPMTLVMVGFRWSILGTVDQEMVFAQPAAILSLLVMLLILIGGVVYFRRTERTFADVI